jgi:hypothetical protein
MSNPGQHEDEDEQKSSGPNLVLIYALMAVAFLAAVAFAVAIVLPFYHRR